MNTPTPATGIAAALAALFTGAQIINNCVNGLRIFADSPTACAISNYPAVGATQFNSAYARNISFFAGGANDLVSFDSPETIFTRIQTFWNLNSATGYTPVICTIIANGALSPPQDGNRLILNGYIRSGFPAAQVCDWATNSHYDTASDTADATYYYDTVHPTSPVGVNILAGIAQPIIANLLA